MRDNRNLQPGDRQPACSGWSSCIRRSLFFILCIAPVFGNCCFAQQGLEQEAHRTSGSVIDRTGAAVRDAQVMAVRDGKILGKATTSSSGSFAISTDAVVETIRVAAAGFENAEVTANHGDNVITLQPASVAVEVNVVANRAPLPTAETAESVAVLSQNQINSSAGLALDEVLRQVPGFTLFRRSSSTYLNPTAQGVSLRGTNASGSSRALVLVDGIPLNDPFGGWIFWDRVPRADVDRIEVLKGGSSELYGSDALAGTVALFTQPLDITRVTAESSYG